MLNFDALRGGGEAAASCLPASGGMMFPPPLAAECSKNPTPKTFWAQNPAAKAARTCPPPAETFLGAAAFAFIVIFMCRIRDLIYVILILGKGSEQL